MLDGLLEEFIKRLNEHLEPIKDQCKNIDRFSMLLLVIGFFGTALFASVFGYLVGLHVAFILGSLFIIILACTFYRSNRQLQALHKSLMLHMAIIVYIENQNIFLQRGIRA